VTRDLLRDPLPTFRFAENRSAECAILVNGRNATFEVVEIENLRGEYTGRFKLRR
jgi:hypothetical protein